MTLLLVRFILLYFAKTSFNVCFLVFRDERPQSPNPLPVANPEVEAIEAPNLPGANVAVGEGGGARVVDFGDGPVRVHFGPVGLYPHPDANGNVQHIRGQMAIDQQGRENLVLYLDNVNAGQVVANLGQVQNAPEQGENENALQKRGNLYSDRDKLKQFVVTQLMTDEIERIYVHLNATINASPTLYSALLFVRFEATFMVDFRGASEGRGSRFLTLLNDFNFLPTTYKVVLQGTNFRNLKIAWENYLNNMAHFQAQLPPIPNVIQVPFVFRDMFSNTEMTNNVIRYGTVMRYFTNYFRHFPPHPQRKQAFSDE